MSEPVSVPFSYPIDPINLPPKGRDYNLVPTEAERDAMARALGLESLDELKAQLSVRPSLDGTFEVVGKFTARLVQACVVTLAPVPAKLEDEITRRFIAAPKPPRVPEKVPAADDQRFKKRTKKAAPEPEEVDEGWVDPNEEITDLLVDGKIDLGEVLTEQLSLSLDPYPRAPGASFQTAALGDQEGEEVATGPFAALAGLKVGKAAPRRTDSKGSGKTRPAKGKSGR